ncbi:MAG TPA: penicillin acylase family protein [Cytophagales bacterium]|nr:penicillin acylase family protein [Cytophagales bacterium]HAP63889.1 penicillin acylase family protein [Cytophagales bacterium]
MKIVLRLLLGLIALLLVGALVAFFYVKSSRTPTYDGELNLEGLSQPVSVYYTEYGVPHIYAETPEDAYRAFGYIHAQDRLWQMDLLRHVGSGRLSELFGESQVENDKFLRTMGMGPYAKASAEAFRARNHTSLPLVEAYLDGINEYIATQPKPLEHLVLGVEIAPFELHNILEITAYMAFSFQNAQATDPVITEMAHRLDSTYLQDLDLYHYAGETTIPTFDDRYATLADRAMATLETLGVPEFIGSNSWAVSGSRTASGKPIFENDPHIGYAQPAIWYEAHLNYPGVEYYGYHLGGVPFPLLMHNERQANGITMFMNDDMDFYVEEINPEDASQYRHRGEWKPIASRDEVIQVKGGESVPFTVRSTVHGPMVSDIMLDHPLQDPVAMYWITTQHENYTLETLYGYSRASSLEEFETALSRLHGPGLNIMYADSAGNVAWWACAKLIDRRNEEASKTFYDGASGLDDAERFHPFADNPHSINPPEGYVYSANNQPDSINGKLYSGYYLPDLRARRVVHLIESEEKVTVDSVKQMALDQYAPLYDTIQPILLASIANSADPDLLAALRDWDFQMDTEAFAPLIYQRWMYEIIEQAQKDELGDTLWATYRKSNGFKVVMERLLVNEASRWWDNVHTEAKESRTDILMAAFDSTLQDLSKNWGEDYTQWRWGAAHPVTHAHTMGTALSFLNVGPLEAPAGNEVLNNIGYRYGDAKVHAPTFGPSTRRIVDFADVRNNSWSILPTGQSGAYFSPHYADQAEMYVRGEFRKMMMNHEEIQGAENKLVLTPQN